MVTRTDSTVILQAREFEDDQDRGAFFIAHLKDFADRWQIWKGKEFHCFAAQ